MPAGMRRSLTHPESTCRRLPLWMAESAPLSARRKSLHEGRDNYRSMPDKSLVRESARLYSGVRLIREVA
jgi:hypothetical protein